MTLLPWCLVLLVGVNADRPQEVNITTEADSAGFIQLGHVDEPEILAKRNHAFDTLWKKYFSHYRQLKGTMLSMPGLKPWEIPVQYEFEIFTRMYKLHMTPEFLLTRGRIEDPSFNLGTAFESTPLWDIGVDGHGDSHSQMYSGLPEADSAFVRPKTVLDGTLARELVDHMRDKMHVPDSETKNTFQFTFGIQLERIRELMQHNPHMKARVVETHKFCQNKCSRKYEGLMLLFQMVMDQAVKATDCGFPKRFQSPWLLRTHVGDLAMTLSEEERQHLADDVMKLWGKDRQLYPKGIMDYLLFPEMAEISGVVKKRIGPSGDATMEMPTDLDGLKQVAAKMLENSEVTKRRLAERPCTLNAPGDKNWTAPTAREWLEGAQKGLDLMSDHDSPAAQASLSKNLWKSMGSWRWSKEEPRVFLECRSPLTCLSARKAKWIRMNYDEIFQQPALLALELEKIPLED
eukprot:Skav229047  [mRNA]  locus=scaffold2828:59137:60519:+ [translate_table: standard]